jgi:hypothetical protein
VSRLTLTAKLRSDLARRGRGFPCAGMTARSGIRSLTLGGLAGAEPSADGLEAILEPATPSESGKLSLGRFSVSRFTPKKQERLHIGSNADRGPNREGPIKTFAIAFVAGAGRDRHRPGCHHGVE